MTDEVRVVPSRPALLSLPVPQESGRGRWSGRFVTPVRPGGGRSSRGPARRCRSPDPGLAPSRGPEQEIEQDSTGQAQGASLGVHCGQAACPGSFPHEEPPGRSDDAGTKADRGGLSGDHPVARRGRRTVAERARRRAARTSRCARRRPAPAAWASVMNQWTCVVSSTDTAHRPLSCHVRTTCPPILKDVTSPPRTRLRGGYMTDGAPVCDISTRRDAIGDPRPSVRLQRAHRRGSPSRNRTDPGPAPVAQAHARTDARRRVPERVDGSGHPGVSMDPAWPER
jgi:hypothetical protein